MTQEMSKQLQNDLIAYEHRHLWALVSCFIYYSHQPLPQICHVLWWHVVESIALQMQ